VTGPKVVAIGGGHGLAMSLSAISTYAAHTTAVVATSDDGGSSGRLRAELGMAAPGDLRRCLTSVAPDRLLADSLEHRFTAGDLSGHAVGNLVLAGLVDAGNDLVAAADHLSRWLQIDPDVVRVLPATHEPVAMVGSTPSGEVRGQVALEGTTGITAIAIDPPDPKVPDEVVGAIAAADQVVLGPGSFHTSVLAAAVVPGIRDALQESSARTVFVCNLRAEEPEVRGFDVARHVDVLAAHGIAVDVVVAQEGGLPVGEAASVDVVVADVDRPHGLAHDAELLGAVLARLC
jgi:uncharacterized cofD-like protein